MKKASALSFYSSGELRTPKSGRTVLVTAGRCTCTTTSCSDTCVVIEVEAN